MALTKRVYQKGKTCITAQNLNDIQDAIIALEEQMAQSRTVLELDNITELPDEAAEGTIALITGGA